MATETQDLCINMHTHTYTHVCTCMCIPIHIHMQIYKYMHVHTHAYIHKYMHTHTTCTYAHTRVRPLRRLCEELMQMPEAPHVSFVQYNRPLLAPPMLGIHCTHFLTCTGVEQIHPVHGPPKLLATEVMPRNEITFLPFSRGLLIDVYGGVFNSTA